MPNFLAHAQCVFQRCRYHLTPSLPRSRYLCRHATLLSTNGRRGGALRDNTNNGCKGDYVTPSRHSKYHKRAKHCYHSSYFSDVLIGRETITSPVNNCLRMMVCSCTLWCEFVLLRIMFCLCAILNIWLLLRCKWEEKYRQDTAREEETHQGSEHHKKEVGQAVFHSFLKWEVSKTTKIGSGLFF